MDPRLETILEECISPRYWAGSSKVCAQDQCAGQLQLQLDIDAELGRWSSFMLRDGTYFRARWFEGVLQVEQLPDDQAAKMLRHILGIKLTSAQVGDS